MKIFRKCSCGRSPWFDRDEFLQDDNIGLIGYQANFCHLELGYFLFNHLTCNSTIAIPAGLFKDLHDGPVFKKRLYGTEFCQGFCEDKESFEPCENRCECAWVRDVMQVIRNWPKQEYQTAKIAHG